MRRLVVLPTRAHVEAQIGPPSLEEGVIVRGVAEVEGSLARALLGRSHRVASREVVRVVVRRAIDRSPRATALLGQVGLDAEEALDAMESAIAELRRAGVNAGTLANAVDRCASPRDRARGEVLREVMFGGEGLVAQLAALGAIDAAAVAAAIADAIPSADDGAIDRGLFGAKGIEVVDLVGAAPARLAWIEALQARGRAVEITLPTATAGLYAAAGVDDPREIVASSMEARLAMRDDPPSLLHREPGRGGACAALAAALFTGGGAPIAVPEGAIALVGAPSVEVAAEVAAAEAHAAITRGVSPSRVVIALPKLEEAIVAPLRRALGSLGIPSFEARGAPPNEAPSVARVLSLVRVVDRGARKADVVDLLRGVRALAPRRFALARALEDVAGADLVRDGASILAALGGAERAAIEPIVRLLVEPIGRGRRIARGDALRFFARVARAVGVPTSLDDDAPTMVRAEDDGAIEALAVDVAAYRAFADALDALGRATTVTGTESMETTLSAVLREVEVSLESRRLVAGVRAGAVPIVRVRDRIGLAADVLVLMEAHEGGLPSRAGRDPILTRGLVGAIAAVDPARTPPSRALAPAIDLLAALDAIGSARSRAVVIHRAFDEDGRAQPPGAIPAEISRRANVPIVSARARLLRDTPPRSPREIVLAHHLRAASIAIDGGSRPAHVDADALAAASAEVARERAFAAQAIGEVRASPFAGAIELDEGKRRRLVARLRGDLANPMQVTSLDLLLACPFLTFAERVLDARKHAPIEDDGGRREAGVLAHAALLEAYRAIGDEADVVRAAEIAREAAAKVVAGEALVALRRVERERIVEQVVGLVVADLRARGGGRFVDGEVAFGGAKGVWPPLLVRVGDDEIAISGRIDRYDLENVEGALVATVVDYKGSLPDAGIEHAFEPAGGGSIQLPIYARVVAANVSPPPSRVEARYLGYKRAEVGAPVGTSARAKADAAKWPHQAGDAANGDGEGGAVEAVRAAIASIRSGDVAPRRGARCARCEQRSACRAPPVVVATKEGGE